MQITRMINKVTEKKNMKIPHWDLKFENFLLTQIELSDLKYYITKNNKTSGRRPMATNTLTYKVNNIEIKEVHNVIIFSDNIPVVYFAKKTSMIIIFIKQSDVNQM